MTKILDDKYFRPTKVWTNIVLSNKFACFDKIKAFFTVESISESVLNNVMSDF